MLRLCLIWLSVLIAGAAHSQLCTTPGTTPITAIYVCGTESLNFSTQEICGQTPVPVSCPGGFNYLDKNPSFFRFACYTTGTLGFIITPSDPAVDLNWQLFDITSTNPVDVFTNPAMFVAANWSSEPGNTGASTDGTDLLVCAGPGLNTFCRMPGIVAGKSYLLMLSNESSTTGGFSLQFTGGSATITDPVDPHLRDASTNCDRTQVQVRTNKFLLCSSIAADGSDFSIPGVNVVSALPWDCSSVFGTDIITLTLDQPLPLGMHQLSVKNGSDGNTIRDICNRSIPVSEAVSFNATLGLPTPMDKINFEVCSPGYIELQFSKQIFCSSLATDGSDFMVMGPQSLPVSISCNAPMSNKIRLFLPSGFIPGQYQVKLVTGSDGNTIINECGLETPPGATLPFELQHAVSAAFTRAGNPSCGATQIGFLHDGLNGVNNWNWQVTGGLSSQSQTPVFNFSPGNYDIQLIVSNGPCSDTSSQQLSITNDLRADFRIEPAICAGDTLHIENTSSGLVDEWRWDFGNGMSSASASPAPPLYLAGAQETLYSIQLIATNHASNCSDTVRKTIRVMPGCSLEVPTAFTPNGDGKNDFFSPVMALQAKNMQFRVFNRFGQLVFSSRSWEQRWDGRVKGILQDTGVYAWIFEFTDAAGRNVIKRGTVLLIR